MSSVAEAAGPIASQIEASISILLEFQHELDVLYGLHCDACQGFRLWQDRCRQSLNAPGVPVEQRKIFFGRGNPSEPGSRYQHVATVMGVIERNEKTGRNAIQLRQACIVFAYMLWEDHVRGAFAAALGMDKNSVKSPTFGDLGKYRHAIAHNKGRLTKRTEALKLIEQGHAVHLSDDQFYQLWSALIEELNRLAASYAGRSLGLSIDRSLRVQTSAG